MPSHLCGTSKKARDSKNSARFMQALRNMQKSLKNQNEKTAPPLSLGQRRQAFEARPGRQRRLPTMLAGTTH
ncbi:MAG: hypothetical protein ACTTJV_04400 [Ottowia sp.]